MNLPDRQTILHSRSHFRSLWTGSPLIVVGLPRSGSTYISHLISCLDDWYVFDDLYLMRLAMSIGAGERPMESANIRTLNNFMAWQLKARIKHESNFMLMSLSWAEVDLLESSMNFSCIEDPLRWWELLEEWMIRVAALHGASNWGYKAPQDFLSVARLATLFPGARFIHLKRNPYDVLRSMKNLSGEDGSRSQYHPIVYARYWRLAEDTIRAHAKAAIPILQLRYEDMVHDPLASANHIAHFLGAIEIDAIPEMGRNTSHTGLSAGLSPAELKVIKHFAQSEPQGYLAPNPDSRYGISRLFGLAEFFWVSLRFSAYQAMRLLREKDKRHSVKLYLGRILSGWTGRSR